MWSGLITAAAALGGAAVAGVFNNLAGARQERIATEDRGHQLALAELEHQRLVEARGDKQRRSVIEARRRLYSQVLAAGATLLTALERTPEGTEALWEQFHAAAAQATVLGNNDVASAVVELEGVLQSAATTAAAYGANGWGVARGQWGHSRDRFVLAAKADLDQLERRTTAATSDRLASSAEAGPA